MNDLGSAFFVTEALLHVAGHRTGYDAAKEWARQPVDWDNVRLYDAEELIAELGLEKPWLGPAGWYPTDSASSVYPRSTDA